MCVRVCMYVCEFITCSLLAETQLPNVCTALTQQLRTYGLPLGPVYFSAGLQARSQYACAWYCDRPTRSTFSVVFLHPRAKAELIVNIHVAVHASHTAVPVLSKFRHSAALQVLKPAQMLHSPLLHTPIALRYSLPNALPSLQPTFTRRTSGHSLGRFSCLPPPPTPHILSVSAQPATRTVCSCHIAKRGAPPQDDT
jgi:hypothetical protein